MSGDNLHGEQPDIRYNVKVHHQEEWEAMSLTEKMEILTSSTDAFKFSLSAFNSGLFL